MIEVSGYRLVADVLVPVAAVLVSSGVAVWLARKERKDAQAARVRAQVEDSLRNLISHLSYFSAADPVKDPWEYEAALQRLRVEAFMVQSLPQKQYGRFGDWLAEELQRGLGEMVKANERIVADKPDRAERLLEYMGSVRRWALSTGRLIVLWLRDDATAEELVRMSDQLASVDWVESTRRV